MRAVIFAQMVDDPSADPERFPAFHDPFAGGGALPLEAQRLGLEAHASDLNPASSSFPPTGIRPWMIGRAPGSGCIT